MRTLDHIRPREQLYVPVWAIVDIDSAEAHNDAIDGVYDGLLGYRLNDTNCSATYAEAAIVLAAIATRYAHQATSSHDSEWQDLAFRLVDLVHDMATLAQLGRRGSRLIPSYIAPTFSDSVVEDEDDA